MISSHWLTHSVWPSESQRLLLRAVTVPDAAFPEAWQHWRATMDLALMNQGESRLLPLLYRRLVQAGIEDPVLPRFKGVYRNGWVSNQRVFQQIGPTCAVLQEAGIPYLILKGAALAHSVYPDPAWRPMDDFDVLVKPADVMKSLDVLKSLHWEKKHGEPVLEGNYRFRHEAALENNSGVELDLHWRIFVAAPLDAGDAPWWDHPAQVEIRGESHPTLTPTLHLLHAIRHGLARTQISSLRWAVDACYLIRQNAETLDWPSLVSEARRLRAIPAVRDGLAYLTRELDLPIPIAVLEELASLPISPAEQRSHAFWTGAMQRPQYLRFFHEMCRCHYQWIQPWNLPARALCIARHMQWQQQASTLSGGVLRWLGWSTGIAWEHHLRRPLRHWWKPRWHHLRQSTRRTWKRKRDNFRRKMAKNVSRLTRLIRK